MLTFTPEVRFNLMSKEAWFTPDRDSSRPGIPLENRDRVRALAGLQGLAWTFSSF